MTLTKEEALVALRALYDHPLGAFHNAAIARAIEFVDHVGVIPDWLVAWTAKTGRWFVRHDGYVYETTAKSRADAVNNIRFNLYGCTPEADCGVFEAINPAFVIMDAIGMTRRQIDAAAPRDLFGKKTISKADALKRLAQMRKAS